MQLRKALQVAIPTFIIGLLITLCFGASPVTADTGDETTYYLLTDHLGSVDVVLDEHGAVVERRDYLPYGSARAEVSTSEAPETDHKFTGKELDDETGLHYYSARYYDAATGRFVSIDPLVLDEAKTTTEDLRSILKDPQKLNAYTYALSNPLIFVDLFGESAKAMAGFGRMIDGAVRITAGYVSGVLYPKAKLGSVAATVSGGRELISGFVLATKEEEPPEFSEKAQKVNDVIDKINFMGAPLLKKGVIKKTLSELSFEKNFRKLGEKVEEAGKKFGDWARSIKSEYGEKLNDVNLANEVNYNHKNNGKNEEKEVE